MTPRECELAFSDAPITEEWLKSVGFKEFTYYSKRYYKDAKANLLVSILNVRVIWECYCEDKTGYEIFLRDMTKRWQLMRLWEAITDEPLTTQ